MNSKSSSEKVEKLKVGTDEFIQQSSSVATPSETTSKSAFPNGIIFLPNPPTPYEVKIRVAKEKLRVSKEKPVNPVLPKPPLPSIEKNKITSRTVHNFNRKKRFPRLNRSFWIRLGQTFAAFDREARRSWANRGRGARGRYQ